MRIKIFTTILLVFFLIGCQKYGLSVEFPKDSVEEKVVKKAPVKVPTTKALVMRDGKLDCSVLYPQDASFEFDDFRVRLTRGEFDGTPFYQSIIFEPKDYHNDYSIEIELDPEGRPLRQVIVQKQNGIIIGGKELFFQR